MNHQSIGASRRWKGFMWQWNSLYRWKRATRSERHHGVKRTHKGKRAYNGKGAHREKAEVFQLLQNGCRHYL